jgi:branched-chain amino acid transport system substrate-binding protein
LALIVTLALAIAGCSPATIPSSEGIGAPNHVGTDDGIFRLGILGPFTGPSESTGQEFRAAVTMAFDAIGWQIGDVIIELVWIDSQSNPDLAAAAYEQAILEDGIQAAILNWHSSVAASCMEVAAEYQIPHIFPFGAAEEINDIFRSDPERYSYWMNKGWSTPTELTIAYVEAIESAIAEGYWSPADRTVALCAENTAWGRSFNAALRSQLEAEGWTTVAEEYFNLDDVMFHPLLNEFRSKDVALVSVTSTSLPSVAAFINQADEVGLESLIIADGLGWGGQWYEMTGSSSNYVIDQIPGWATAEGHTFAEAFETRWGVPPSASAAGLAYDGTNMFIQVARHALEEYGELSSESIYRWAHENLQTGDWSYTDGIVMQRYQYTTETLPDPVVGEGYYIFPVRQYVDGEGRIVFPPDWATHHLEPGNNAAALTTNN